MSVVGNVVVRPSDPRAVPARSRARRRAGAAIAVLVAAVCGLVPAGTPAGADPPIGRRDVELGGAAAYAVLGGTGVANTGPSEVADDLGVSPGTSITGFPPGQVGPPGSTHVADGAADQAHADLLVAYDDATGRPTGTEVDADLGALRLAPGVYSADARDPLAVTGTVVLDAGGDPNAVFIFQTDSTLDVVGDSSVVLAGEAQACNVFWQVGSTATLGAGSHVVGSILAQTSIVVGTGSTIEGRALALDATVTLDTTRVTTPSCAEDARTRGRVTADDSGDGIAGVTVRLYQDGVGFTSDVATTDGGGYYGFGTAVPDADRRIFFSDPSREHVSEWWADSPTRSASAPVPFDPADEIVMDAGLAPASSMAVNISNPGTFAVHLYAQDPVGSSATQTITTGTGQAFFTGLRAGSYWVSVTDPSGRLATQWWEGRAGRSTATPFVFTTPRSADLDFTLAARNTISGTVTADSGGALAGVTVKAYLAGSGAYVSSAKTASDGAYLLKDLAPGSYKLLYQPASSAHVLVWSGGATTIATADTVDMSDGVAVTMGETSLESSSAFIGTVTGAGRAPIGGAKVTLYRSGVAVKTYTADVEGRWTATGLRSGSYTILFVDPSKAHRSEYSFDRAKKADADVITLEAGSGRLVDAELAPV